MSFKRILIPALSLSEGAGEQRLDIRRGITLEWLSAGQSQMVNHQS